MSRTIVDNLLIFLELQDLGKPSQLTENTPHLSLSLGPPKSEPALAARSDGLAIFACEGDAG
jgi:hypothetical protein